MVLRLLNKCFVPSEILTKSTKSSTYFAVQ
ncbi:Uncharacterised protein r2_g4076 [Pycnogonum litorale]